MTLIRTLIDLVIRILALSSDESVAGRGFIFLVKEVQSSMSQPKNTRLEDRAENIHCIHGNKKSRRDFNGLIICSIPKAIYTHLKGFGNYIKAGRRK